MTTFAKARNSRVTFQAETRVSDGGGGSAVTWADALTVWGDYRPASQREEVAAGRLEASEAGVLTVRYSEAAAALTSAHRVLIGGAVYQLQGGPTNFDQRRKTLDFKVEKGTAG